MDVLSKALLLQRLMFAGAKEAWSAAAAYGALAHDIGKIVVDLQVELQDGSTWHPWNGPINQPYRFKYVKSREYQLHGAASALLIHQLLPRTALDIRNRGASRLRSRNS